MKRKLLLLFLIFICVASMHAAEKGTLPSDSKKVSVTLDETKKAVIGFSSVDAANVGVFGDMTPYLLNDGIELDIQNDGSATNHVAEDEYKHYVFYQIASDRKMNLYIYVDGPLDGETSGVSVNFSVKVSGEEVVNTKDKKGVMSGTSYNGDPFYTHSPSGEDGRYAWADGRGLEITTIDASFYNLKADRFTATMTVEVRTVE